MTDNLTNTFVLVHGAWCGAWVWGKVANGLREMGHQVSTPTLTGIGERRHIGANTASLTTHIEDLAAHVEMENLRNVTLVGWSYGGAVVTGTFPRIAERIKSVIYLDAFVPECGKSMADCSPPEVRSILEEHKEKDEAVPPLPLAFLGITDKELVDFAAPRLSGQPWRTLFEPLQTSWSTFAVPKSYIRCAAHDYAPFAEAYERVKSKSDVRTAIINTTHACMLTHPLDCIRALLSSAP